MLKIQRYINILEHVIQVYMSKNYPLSLLILSPGLCTKIGGFCCTLRRMWHGQAETPKMFRLGKPGFSPKTSVFGEQPTFFAVLEGQGIYIYMGSGE